MKIKIKGYAALKKRMGNNSSFEMKTDASTVRDVLLELCKEFGKGLEDTIFERNTRNVRTDIHVFINGRHYKFLPDRIDTELKDADELSIFPPVVGG